MAATQRTTWTLIPIGLIALVTGGITLSSGILDTTPLERTLATTADDDAPRTVEQQELVNLASSRFASQNLELPEIQIQFHDSLETCGWHKGLYVEETRSLHMCSVDKRTMFHELAHAWANLNLSVERRQAFAERRGLEAWNDHDDPWEDRATEHVAETIAWGLMDEPIHVRWIDAHADGTHDVSYRVLSIEASVDTLLDDFFWLTGGESIYRSSSEWPTDIEIVDFSPEASN